MRRDVRPAPHLAADASPFRIEVRRSPVHGWGVFALQPIPAQRKVIEYQGARISIRRAALELKKTFVPGQVHRVSLFRLDRQWLVDGDDHGNGAVIINHSCDPNLYSRRARGHILYFSRRKIRRGEELFIDYRFPAGSTRTPCHCGAWNCRGVINKLEPEPNTPKRTSPRKAKR